MSLKLELVQRPGILQTTSLSLITSDPAGRVYELFDYWDRSKKNTINLHYDGKDHTIEYVIAPSSLTDYVHPNEKYGVQIQGHVFINDKLATENPDLIPYVAIKLYAEQFVEKQGIIAQHQDALYRTIRLAERTLSEEKLRAFLTYLEKHESTGYFQYDEEAARFLKAGKGNVREAKARYLEAHHNNLFVQWGRQNEFLAEAGIDHGFRIHAEAIASRISSLPAPNYYVAVDFIRNLMRVQPGEPIIIQPPLNEIAYLLTLEGNGIVDIVRFLDHHGLQEKEDLIARTPGGRQATLVATSKRLSYTLFQQEKAIAHLVAAKSKALDGLIASMGDINDLVLGKARQIVKDLEKNTSITSLVPYKKDLAETKTRLSKTTEAARIAEENIGALEELLNFVSERI